MEAGGTPATPTKPLQRRSFVGFVPRTIIIGAHSAPYVFSSGRSPDGMQWNPGEPFDRLRTGFGHAHQTPDFAALHPGYVTGDKHADRGGMILARRAEPVLQRHCSFAGCVPRTIIIGAQAHPTFSPAGAARMECNGIRGNPSTGSGQASATPTKPRISLHYIRATSLGISMQIVAG